MITPESVMRYTRISVGDKEALIGKYSSGDLSSIPEDMAEIFDALSTVDPCPLLPEEELSQIDIDGILFVELPAEMTINESRRWLAMRMNAWAFDQVEKNNLPHVLAPFFLQRTRRNIHHAISAWRRDQYEKWYLTKQPKDIKTLARKIIESRLKKSAKVQAEKRPAETVKPVEEPKKVEKAVVRAENVKRPSPDPVPVKKEKTDVPAKEDLSFLH